MPKSHIGRVKKTRGTPLFTGVEHVGLYPTNMTEAQEVVAWYKRRFGFTKRESKTSIMLSGRGSGRVEVMKSPEANIRCHVAIRVSNFERACNYLKEKGIELEEPVGTKDVKAVYLKNPDPAGNKVHLICKKTPQNSDKENSKSEKENEGLY